MVKREGLLALVAAAMMLSGCFRRHATARLIYVPASPSPSSQSGDPSEAVVIEQPPPPEPQSQPQVLPLPEPPAVKPAARPHHTARSEPPTPDDTASRDASPEVPPLEPRATSEQQEKWRGEITGVANTAKERISRLNQKKLSDADQKTLGDAGRFLAESERAFAEGDFQRSLNLAHKASLLVDAVEKSY